jgi:hypothetical protein
MSPGTQFLLITFCDNNSLAANEFHIRNDLLLIKISLYNYIMCRTLECEHVHFEISMTMSYVFAECKCADL